MTHRISGLRPTRIALLLAALAAPAAASAAETSLVNLLGAPAPAVLPDSGTSLDIEKVVGQHADLWERIRSGFAMPDLAHPLVARHEAYYASRPELMRGILSRGRLYLHFIVEELERRGMPTELALLPIVESGFNPMALSPAQASGLWQFIPETGSRYKLEQNASYDARRDIVSSTGAALDYLQFLYEMHKDWHLALASYNWGENSVARVAERSRERRGSADFGDLSLPEETRQYVPRLQAIKNLIADPARFGLNLDEIPNEPYFALVPSRTGMPLAVAAKLAGMTADEFAALNPAWKQPRVAGERAPALVLPIDRVSVFRTNAEQWELEQHGELARQKSREKPRARRSTTPTY